MGTSKCEKLKAVGWNSTDIDTDKFLEYQNVCGDIKSINYIEVNDKVAFSQITIELGPILKKKLRKLFALCSRKFRKNHRCHTMLGICVGV